MSDRQPAPEVSLPTPTEPAEILRLAGELLQVVLRRTHLSSAPDLATIVAEEARTIGVDHLALYILDHEQKCLVPVPGPGVENHHPVPVQGTVVGRSFIASSIRESHGDGEGRRLWLPLLDGTERLGVVEMTFAGGDAPLPEALVELCERYAHLTATLITNKDLYMPRSPGSIR